VTQRDTRGSGGFRAAGPPAGCISALLLGGRATLRPGPRRTTWLSWTSRPLSTSWIRRSGWSQSCRQCRLLISPEVRFLIGHSLTVEIAGCGPVWAHRAPTRASTTVLCGLRACAVSGCKAPCLYASNYAYQIHRKCHFASAFRLIRSIAYEHEDESSELCRIDSGLGQVDSVPATGRPT
jgi:hypothetical protein